MSEAIKIRCKICACVKILKSHPCPKNSFSWYHATGGGGKGTETSKLTLSKQNSLCKCHSKGHYFYILADSRLSSWLKQCLLIVGGVEWKACALGPDWLFVAYVDKSDLLWQYKCPPLQLLSMQSSSPFKYYVQCILGCTHCNYKVPLVCLIG